MEMPLSFYKHNESAIAQVIVYYYNNFINDDGTFNSQLFANSCMEGELIDDINGELFSDDEAIMCGMDYAYEYVDSLINKYVDPKILAMAEKVFDNDDYTKQK
jgi:hypothetical protein